MGITIISKAKNEAGSILSRFNSLSVVSNSQDNLWGKKKRWLIIFELMREGDEHRRVTFDATNISASLAAPSPSPYPLQKVWSVRILAFGSYPHHRYPQLDIHF